MDDEEAPRLARRLSRWAVLGYATGHVLNDMCASMWFTYLLIFFHSVLRFENTYSGVVLLAGQIADGLSTVFVGYFIDAGDDMWLCNRYGKRKSWHLLGTVCVLASFQFIFVPCLSCQGADHRAQLVYFVAFVIIFQFGWASVQISHLSMIPVLSGGDDERTRLTSYRYTATVLSNTAVYCLIWLSLGIQDRHEFGDSIGPNDAPAFRNVATMSLAAGGLSSLVFHLAVRVPEDYEVLDDANAVRRGVADQQDDGAPPQQGVAANNGASEPARRSMSFSDWLREPQLYQVALVYMSTRLFVNISQSYTPFYLQVTLKEPAVYIAVIPLVMFLSGFLVAVVLERATRRIGRKLSFGIACLIGIAGSSWILAGDIHDAQYAQYEIFAVAVLFGGAGSAMIISSLSLTADLIGSNLDSSGLIYGCMSLLDKFSNGIAIMIIQKNIPEPCFCPDDGMYFKHLLVWLCGGAAVSGILAVATLIPATIGQRRRDRRQLVALPDDSDGAGS